MMENDWGPWIEHDGKGCPCVGRYVQREYAQPTTNFWGRKDTICEGRFAWGIAENGHSWMWAPGWNPIIRYRVRKPRGMTILEQLLQDLPAPVGPKVSA